MTKEEIIAKLRPLEDAVENAKWRLAEAKVEVRNQLEKPVSKKPVKILKGDTKGSEVCIDSVFIDRNYEVWYSIQLGISYFYYTADFLEFLSED
jgi:hypothetical protein